MLSQKFLVPLFSTDAASEGRAGSHALPSGEEEGEANKRQFWPVANNWVANKKNEGSVWFIKS